MKKQTLSTILAASLLATLAAAAAYAGRPARIAAKVPFAFSVGGQSLPDGAYTFYQRADGAIEVLGPTGKRYVSYTVPGKSEVRAGGAQILFHRYDDQYFLSEVFDGVGSTGLKFPVSRQEKEKISTASHPKVAYVVPRDVIVVATN